MEPCYKPISKDESTDSSRKIIMDPLYLPKSSALLDLRVFYVRISSFEGDDSTPENLTLHHIPLTPDTIIEVNGRRCGIYSECISCLLRRDRVDKRSEEATFVCTDSIRMTGSVRFEVFDKNDLLLCGLLELSSSNGIVGEPKKQSKKWSMKCESVVSGGIDLLKGRLYSSMGMPRPMIEVYVAGCFLGSPIILTKTLQLDFQREQKMKLKLDSIPEYEMTEQKRKVLSDVDLQLLNYQDYKEHEAEIDYNSIYSRAGYFEGEDGGELSWFNAGVRVGLGIGLGICVGVGIGIGLLVRTYQATTRNFKKR